MINFGIAFIFQNPPTENQEAGQYDLHWAIPAISPAEKYFLSQLISSPNKDVSPFSSLYQNFVVVVSSISFKK